MLYSTNTPRKGLRKAASVAMSILLLWGSFSTPALAEMIELTQPQSADEAPETLLSEDSVANAPEQLDLSSDALAALPSEELPSDDQASVPADEELVLGETEPAPTSEPETQPEAIDQADDASIEVAPEEDLAIEVQSGESADTSSIPIEDEYGLDTQAGTSGFTMAMTHNVSEYAPYSFASPTTSYLHENANGVLERVEYVNGDLIVEKLSSSLRDLLEAKKVIDPKTYQPSGMVAGNFVWGGFYSGASHNYVVAGQINPSEKKNIAVIRVTQYTKDWKLVKAAELKTTHTGSEAGTAKNNEIMEPFRKSGVDMVEAAGELHVRTAILMYDGHQSNIHLVIRQSDMSITDNSMNGTLNHRSNLYGYVSHSFGQKLTKLGSTVYAVDHGDAYPRAVSLKKIGAKGDASIKDLLEISGAQMNNFTGVTLGGLSGSQSQGMLLTAVASINQNRFNGLGDNATRNIYVHLTNAQLSVTQSLKITSHNQDGDVGADFPKLVKINDNLFLVAWANVRTGEEWWYNEVNQTGKVSYIFLNGQGKKLSATKKMDGYISDCQPIVYGNKVVWYAEDVNKSSLPVFYTIDYESYLGAAVVNLGSIRDASVGTIPNQTHTGKALTPKPQVVSSVGVPLEEGTNYKLEYKNNVNPGMASIVIKGINGYSGSKTVNFVIVGTPTITAANKTVEMGKTVALGAKVTSGAGKLSYTSSSANYAKVDAYGKVTPVRPGTVTITITSAATSYWKAASKQVTVTIKALAQPMTVKATAKTILAATLKSKAGTTTPLKVTKAQGKVTYKKASGSSCLTINKTTGKVTIKKGTKKGKYTIKVKVTAAGNTKYAAGSKTVTATITVK